METLTTPDEAVTAYHGDVEFLILGPVELVARGQRKPLGGPKQRTVLAMIIAVAGRSVSFDQIIEATWGDEPPDGARASVHTYISNLRSLVGDVIERLGDGYVLRVEGDAIDAVRFEDLFRRASEMLEDAPEQAADMLRDALRLWRGHPYADVDARGALEPEITRLTELRVSTLLARIDADLALGHHSGLIGELESLSAEHPLQEGFRAREMLALYRSGRQADALRVYDRTRRYLGEELGIDPSRELQRLEQQILDHDSSLDLVVRGAIRHAAVLVADVGAPETLTRLDPGSRTDLVGTMEAAVESSVAGAGGSEFAVRGSAQYATFERVADAIHAAELTHRALDGSHQVPRIALDVGDLETQANGEFTGPAVARAAALAAAAHAGQVLISSDAHDELTSNGTDGWQVRALGSHRLWGFDRALPIYQLLIEGREQTFPPLQVDAMPPALPGAGRGLFGYELRDLVGRGTFGEVYRAYQPSVGREVAVKVLRARFANEPEFIRLFEVEAQLVARLEHPHIVPLYDYWREPDRAYLVMRWLRGGSLADRLAEGPMSPESTALTISQIGGALLTAHRHGVVHRDIKPSNVMLDEEGNAYLTDFGIAQSLTNPEDLSAIAAAYQSPEYVSPEMRSGEPVTPATDIFALGVLSQHALTGQPPSTEAGTPADASMPPSVDSVIRTATSPDPSQRFADVGQFVVSMRRALGTASEADPSYTLLRNPYKGLAAFAESDAADFHGRDGVVGEILSEVADARLIAVVGPSGIGKSSVVRAGVVPELRSGAIPGSSEWFITEMVPGAYPFEELATALMRVATETNPDLEDDLQRDRRGVLRSVKRLLPPDSELVIVIDQFEELFTLARPETRDAFLDALTTLVTDDRSPARVVVTIRADYFDQPLRHAELGAILRSSTVPVGAPTVDELHQIVEDPAAPLGVGFEPGLSDRIVGEVDGQPGALPLVEYALTALFDARERDRITASDFAAVGGVLGALGNRADAIFAALDPSGREAARQMFLRLVSVDESLRPTRRRVRRAELHRLSVPRRDLEAVLVAFGEARLLTFDRDTTARAPTVEVAHEALFSEWGRLAGWIEEHREDLLMARRLAAAADDWESADRTEDYLLSGGALAQHEEWTADTELTLTSSEHDLLAASRLTEDDHRHRQRRRRIGIVSGFAVAAVLSLALAATAFVARSNAEQEARVATARGLSSAAAANVDEDPERSLLLALAAADTTRSAGEPVLMEAVEAVRRSLGEHRVLARYPTGGGVAISPDGSLMAIGGVRLLSPGEWGGPGIEIRDTASGELVRTLAEGEGLCCGEGINFAPDNRTVWVSAGRDDDDVSFPVLSVWDAVAGTELARYGEAQGTWGFSPDGSLLVAIDDTGSAALWNWRADVEVTSFEVREPWGASFSPDGKLVAIGDHNAGSVALFATDTGAPVRPVDGSHEGGLSDIAFSPDGTKVASSSNVPSRILVSDVATGVLLLDVSSPVEGVERLVWSPDGRELALAGGEGELAIINAATGEERLRLSGISGKALGPAWFPDGTRIAVSGRANETVVWDARHENAAGGAIVGTPATTFSGAWFTEDESKIVVPLWQEGLSLFDTTTSTEIERTMPPGAVVEPPFFPSVSPDGSHVAMGGDQLTIYDTKTLSPVRAFGPGVPMGDAFSPNGSAIAAIMFGQDEDRAGLVDGSTGEFILTFDESSEPYDAAFHPTGHYVVVVGNYPVSVHVYDTRTGGVVFTAKEGGTAVGVSPDGSKFAIIDFNGYAYLFDFDLAIAGTSEEEALIRAWQAYDGFGLAVEWTTDSSRLLFAGFDERTVIYDGEGQEVLERLPTGQVGSIDFSEDGKRALLAAENGPRIIILDIEELLATARSRLTRGFTPSECVEFFPDAACPTLEDLKRGSPVD